MANDICNGRQHSEGLGTSCRQLWLPLSVELLTHIPVSCSHIYLMCFLFHDGLARISREMSTQHVIKRPSDHQKPVIVL